MRAVEALTLAQLFLVSVSAAESPRPRGVGPEFAKFYKSTELFTCISNPSISIPFSLVNDDYCDCPDGSDEPGTTACSYLSPLSPHTPADISSPDTQNVTIALPGFYCKNKGHQPSYLPFTNVNDGVCDYDLCCDGSEEYDGVGGVKCEDHCKEIGKEWKKHDETRQKALGEANRRRKELVAEAARLRKEVEDMVGDLEAVIQGQEVKVKQLEAEVEEVERDEQAKAANAPVKTSKLSTLGGFAKERIEELRENLVRVRQDRDLGRERVKELENILSTFKTEYNPNFNDEGVKRAVRAWEDYAARDKGTEADEAHDRDLDEIVKPDHESETGIRWEEWEDEGSSDVDVLYHFETYLPGPLRTWLDSRLRAFRLILIENGILASPPTTPSTSESKPLRNARERLQSARDSLNAGRTSLQSHKEDLQKDYGPSDIFRPLKGICVSKDSGEYTYEICWLDRTTQKSKKGGAQTSMGTFVRMEMVDVDEGDVPPDGKGLGSGRRVALKYENGQHCWNGPSRSTTVLLACAEKDEIWKIAEEEKCVYRMEVGTPAVCEIGVGGWGNGKGEGKDEL